LCSVLVMCVMYLCRNTGRGAVLCGSNSWCPNSLPWTTSSSLERLGMVAPAMFLSRKVAFPDLWLISTYLGSK
jgi:hypothetical protein